MQKNDYDKSLRRYMSILTKLSNDERPNTKELAKECMQTADSNIIFSKTPHFSATSDLVYFKHNNYIL